MNKHTKIKILKDFSALTKRSKEALGTPGKGPEWQEFMTIHSELLAFYEKLLGSFSLKLKDIQKHKMPIGADHANS